MDMRAAIFIFIFITKKRKKNTATIAIVNSSLVKLIPTRVAKTIIINLASEGESCGEEYVFTTENFGNVGARNHRPNRNPEVQRIPGIMHERTRRPFNMSIQKANNAALACKTARSRDRAG